MSVDLERVEGFAELFHHYYQALGPDFDASPNASPDWHELGLNERRRFVAATRLALMEARSHSDNSYRSEEERSYGTEGRECGC
jgi:hypothetical protein